MTLRQTITASLVALTALIYSLFVEPQWIEVTRHSKEIGLGVGEITIAQVSDLHTHSLGRAEKNTLTALREVRPDIMVITGDAIDDRGSLLALDSYLKQLPIAVKVATLGNWEYWAEVDLQELRDVYRKNGVTLLVNDCMTVSAKGNRPPNPTFLSCLNFVTLKVLSCNTFELYGIYRIRRQHQLIASGQPRVWPRGLQALPGCSTHRHALRDGWRTRSRH
jgi:hypothetical protein